MPNPCEALILIGAPNSGKTSLFNKLTGLNKDVMNYPGSTTETSRAPIKQNLLPFKTSIIDTPGIYGFGDASLEEAEVLNILNSEKNALIVCVIDCRFFSHRMELLTHLIHHYPNKIIVYTTHAASNNLDLDVLSKEYKVPFIDANGPFPIKTLLYAVENIDIPQNTLSVKPKHLPQKNITPKIDKWVLTPYLGALAGLLILISLFSLAFFIVAPLSEYIEIVIDCLLGYISENPIQSFPFLHSLTSGVLLGVGTLLMFTPQVIGLFFVVLLIQESGYLARAAIIFDPLLAKIGLHGKSIAPILAGFSCAIPAILLAKTIESKKEKLLTILAIPLMLCSARVPVYTLCISFLFYGYAPWISGLAFAACYILSLLLGCFATALLNKFTAQNTASFLMMELPHYKLPNAWTLLKKSVSKSFVFVKNAGPIIVVLSTFIWAATTFPNHTEQNAAERLNQSYAAQLGRFIEPAFTPMGADWRVGTAILTSFAAREVFVSSLSLFLGQDLTKESGKGVFDALRLVKKQDSSPVFSFASTLAILIFFMLALQCTSTTAITAKELKSWKIAIYQFIFMNSFAYVIAVIVYQLLTKV